MGLCPFRKGENPALVIARVAQDYLLMAEEPSCLQFTPPKSGPRQNGFALTALLAALISCSAPARWGASLDAFFAGPGTGQPIYLPTDLTGGPADTGLNWFNQLSLRYFVTDSLALELQSAHQLVITGTPELRNQGFFLGLGGVFFEDDRWNISGSINTIVPWVPLMGQINTERTLVFAPGAFLFAVYRQTGNPWFGTLLVTPRFNLYSNREALSAQDQLLGGAQFKPEYGLALNPCVNYQWSDSFAFRAGFTLEWLKNVGWSSLQRNFLPIEIGGVYEFAPQWNINAAVTFSGPWDQGLREQQGYSSKQWWNTFALALWVRGTVDDLTGGSEL